MGRPPPPETCANCGADIPRNARACPECGADERTGWRDQDVYDDLDLPDSAWEDDDAAESRRANAGRDPDTGLAWYWTATALALTIGAILYALSLL